MFPGAVPYQGFFFLLPESLENSRFLNRLRKSTIQPQEIEKAGRAEMMIALTGEISVKMVGPKNMIKMTSIIKNHVTFSRIEVGGVKKILGMSISRRSGSFAMADSFLKFILYLSYYGKGSFSRQTGWQDG